MEVTFNYIRNKIRKCSKDDLLYYCYSELDNSRNKIKPVWYIFLLMKWTYVYGGDKNSPNKLDHQRFISLLNLVTNFNEKHISNFIKKKQISKAFQILHSQQFYLQKTVYYEIFTTQLKLYSTISGKYDIDKSFKKNTGISIYDFLHLFQLCWLYTNSTVGSSNPLHYNGYLSNDFIKLLDSYKSNEVARKFLFLLSIDEETSIVKIDEFRRQLRDQELQPMETSFFTMSPFQLFNGKLRVIHQGIMNYVANYFIYDYLKSNDEKFPKEMGSRVEKYVEFGLNEIKYNFIKEIELIKQLPKHSKVIDYYLPNENIYIECKAIEIPSYPLVNPKDELLYNSMKDSLMKAYFNQLLNIAKFMNSNGENYGIIITYKELFWSDFSELFEIGKNMHPNSNESHILPPENVFIIDLYTWDKIIQLIKDKKTTLLEILVNAKNDNKNPVTRKLLFSMHLDVYKLNKFNLSYLNEELEILKAIKKS